MGLLIGTVGCQQDVAPVKTADPVRPARIFEVVSPSDATWHRFPGKVAAADQAALAFRVPGELKTLPIHAGMEVKKGAVLAKLDISRTALTSARTDLSYTVLKAPFSGTISAV